MADRLDDLLTTLGQEANDQVDFDAAFAQVLAKAKAGQPAPAEPQKAGPRWRHWRVLSMAAAVVVVLGAAVLLRATGFLGGMRSGSAAPSDMPSGDAMPQLAAAQVPAPLSEGAAEDAMEPSLAAPAAEPAAGEAEPRVASGPAASPFYGQGAMLAPSTQEDTGAQSAASAGEAPEVLGDICMVGTAKAEEALLALQSQGYEASLGSSAYVDQERPLADGEACIAPGGQTGVWNTGDGYITLTSPAMTQLELYEAFASAL